MTDREEVLGYVANWKIIFSLRTGLGTAKGKFNFVGEAGDWVQGQSSRVHGTEPTWSSARERPRETSPRSCDRS